MFDFLKKKKVPAYDVTNLSLKDLNVGFIFDYDMKSWVVKEVYKYDWGNNNFTSEYKVDSGDEVAFLHIADEGELEISLSKSIRLSKIDEAIADEIEKNEKPPRKIHFNEKLYFLEEDAAGYFRDLSKETEDWEELISWEYLNDEATNVLSITQWDIRNIEASAGLILKEYQFSNIIPSE
ncbi:MAG: DUF4178 domain-containing protein [Cyclobacteriaceae bacterium]|jgi:hypothetical protein|nr:DUF4178 domain-containing protein [Cyclobacteriaceae bacterium]|tara:strand:+ start:216 stop:755 length:540 start_codon:yes stop_codon:yes gene_type:complete